MEGSLATTPNPEKPDLDIRARLLLSSEGITPSADTLLGNIAGLEPSRESADATSSVVARLGQAFSYGMQLRAHLPEQADSDDIDGHFETISTTLGDNLGIINSHAPETTFFAAKLALRSAEVITDGPTKIEALMNTVYCMKESFGVVPNNPNIPVMNQVIPECNKAAKQIEDPREKAYAFVEVALFDFKYSPEDLGKKARITKTIDSAVGSANEIKEPYQRMKALRTSANTILDSYKTMSPDSDKSKFDLLSNAIKFAEAIKNDTEIENNASIATRLLTEIVGSLKPTDTQSKFMRFFAQETLYTAYNLTNSIGDSPEKAHQIIEIADEAARILPIDHDGNGLVSKAVTSATPIMIKQGNFSQSELFIYSLKELIKTDIAPNRKKEIVANLQFLASKLTIEEGLTSETQKLEKANTLVSIAQIREEEFSDDPSQARLIKNALENARVVIGKLSSEYYKDTHSKNLINYSVELAQKYSKEANGEALSFYTIAIKTAEMDDDVASGLFSTINIAKSMENTISDDNPQKNIDINNLLAKVIEADPNQLSINDNVDLAREVSEFLNGDPQRLKIALELLSRNPKHLGGIYEATEIASEVQTYSEQRSLLELAINNISIANNELPGRVNFDGTYTRIAETIRSLVIKEGKGNHYLSEVTDQLPRKFRKFARP